MYQWRVATESDWFRFKVHLGQPRVQVGTPSWTFEIYFWFGVLHSSYSTRVTTAWVVWQFESAMLKQIVIHSKFIHKTFRFRCRFAQSWSDFMRWCVAIYSHECLQLLSMVLPTTLLSGRHCGFMKRDIPKTRPLNRSFNGPHRRAPYPSCWALKPSPYLS